MIGIGFGVLFAGYSTLVWSWSQLRGSNVSLVDLVWPGKYTGQTNPDSGSYTKPSSAPAPTKSTASSIGTPSTATPAQRRNTNQNHVAK